MSKKTKDPAAVSLGKRRWADTTAEDRSKHMRALALKRSRKAKKDPAAAEVRRVASAKGGRAGKGVSRSGRPPKNAENDKP